MLPRRLSSALLTLLVAASAAAAGTASAAALPAGSTAILSGASSLFDPLPTPVGPSRIRGESVSGNGRYVAFSSESDGLLEGDDDTVQNVYLKDMQTGALTLLSRRDGVSGEPTHADCSAPAISSDGRTIAFRCAGPLADEDTNGTGDVYVRRPETGATILVSRVTRDGAPGDADSSQPSVSGDGAYVAFTSYASNLDQAANSSAERVFRRALGGGRETVLVSRRPGVGGAAVRGFLPSISDDGDRIAFATAEDAVPGTDANGLTDVYVRTVLAGTTVLASRADGDGAVGNGDSTRPALAGNGTAVAFESLANNFDFATDPDKESNVYRRSLVAKATALVDVNANGDTGERSTRPSIDASGNVVGFVSRATALDPGDTDPTEDAYVKNVATSELQVASRISGSAEPAVNREASMVAVSGDGKKAASSVDLGGITPDTDPREQVVALRDLTAPHETRAVSRPAGSEPFVNQGAAAEHARLSADGRYAVFHSTASGLGLLPLIPQGIFVRDRVTGAVELVSRADGPGGAPLRGDLLDPVISSDGRRVAFAARPTLSSSGKSDVWVRDLAAGRTYLASRADGASGAAGDDSSRAPRLSADGTRVLFASEAANLGDGDTDHVKDLHVRDLRLDRTVLVNAPAAGPKSTEPGYAGSISADGSQVAFVSSATNLGDGDDDPEPDVHVRDLVTGATRLVSATPDGVNGDGTAFETSIDASGRRIAFSSNATNLGGGASTRYKVFVRDLAADTLVLASRADGADGAAPDDDATVPFISPDGGYVAFQSYGTNLPAGAAGAVGQTYRRDLARGRTDLVSRGGGADGAPSQDYTEPYGISADGGCVAFRGDAPLVGPSGDLRQVYLRALREDCATEPPPAADGGDGGDAGGGVGPSGDGGVQGGGARDTTAPVLSGVRLVRRRFRVGRAATPLAAAVRRGTTLRLRSSEAGTLTLRIERVRPGRRRARSAGTLTRRLRAGAQSVRLTGRVGRRRLRAGRYRLVVAARDAAGNRSRPVRLRFTVR